MSAIVFDNYKTWLDEQKIPKGQKKALLAGLDLFAKQGYNGTSTAQIAEKAEISQATIFKYFKTKQDLLVAIIQPVLDNFFPRYRDDFLGEFEEFSQLEKAVHFFIHNRYQFVKDNEDAIMIILSESLVNDEIRTMFMKAINDSSNPIVPKVGQILKSTGELRDDLDLPAVIRTIAGQVVLYFMQHRFIGNQNEEKDLKMMEEQIIRAIKK